MDDDSPYKALQNDPSLPPELNEWLSFKSRASNLVSVDGWETFNIFKSIL